MVYLTRQQVREVDRRAIAEYGIPGVVLMENAARGAAAVALRMLKTVDRRTALILCGGGNNGGDGLAIARHLHNHGIAVHIALCTDPAGYKGDALTNWRIVQRMKLPAGAVAIEMLGAATDGLIVDAIFGTGLSAPPRPPFEAIAQAVHRSGRPVLAVDLPSGLDCDTGLPLGACIGATHTVTFVARKKGFANPASRQFTGRVTVVGIGCPRELVQATSSGESGT